MHPLTTLFIREEPINAPLPPELERLYGGQISFPENTHQPYVLANFVTSQDGIVALNQGGRNTGSEISGKSEIDHVVMGILRACADAVIWGSRNYAEITPYVPTPAAIWPPGDALYREVRQRLGKPERPLAVIVTASGNIPRDGKALQAPEQPAAILTSQQGAERLRDFVAPNTRVIAAGDADSISPAQIIAALASEYHAQTILHEGGASLFGAFLRDHLVDELFQTLAPQIVGRSLENQRIGLVEGVLFAPDDERWGDLISVKQEGSHLFLRYRYTHESR